MPALPGPSGPSDRSAAPGPPRADAAPCAWWGEGRAAVRAAARAVLDEPALRDALGPAGGGCLPTSLGGLPLVPSTVCEAVRGAVRGGDDDGADGPPWTLLRDLRRLRATVHDYVAHRREEGAAVERVLPEVWVLVGDGGDGPAGVMRERIVRWSLEAYYDEPALASVPRFY